MARSVSVFLRANVTGFVSQVRRAGHEVNRLSRQVDESSGRQRRAFQRTGQAANVMAIGLVGGFLLGTKAAMDFDKQMSAVEAVAGATAAEMDKLRKSALEMGRTTAYSATKAARAQEELVKAGVSAADVIGGGLKGALDLASAGTIEVGEAAEVAATAMTQFKLSGKDVPHIADLLSAGANKAQGTVHQLGFALRMGGLVSSQFGLSVEETVGSLAAFASAGLIGSDAGTSFKTMLIHLGAPSKKAADVMRELGISAYDSQGQFIGVTALAGQLEHQLGGLTQAQRDAALSTMFGTDGLRAANVLYRQGAGGMQGWINKVNDSGNASETAAKKLDNLAGDLTKLKGAFTTALIGAGSGAQGPLRDLTQNVTGAVNAFNTMPTSAQHATFWIIGVSGAAILAARGLIFMVTTTRDARIALAALGLTHARVAAMAVRFRAGMAASAAFMTGPWGIAIAAGVGALAIWHMSKNKAAKATTEFTSAIQADSGALGTNTRATIANQLEKEGLLKTAQALGINLPTLTDAVMGNSTAYGEVKGKIDAYIKALETSKNTKDGDADRAIAATKLRTALEGKNAEVKASVEATKREGAATKTTVTAQQQATTSSEQNARAQANMAAAMTDATLSAENLQKALEDLSGANMEADRAAIAQARSAKAAADANDHRRRVTLDEKSALLDLAEADQKQLVKMKENGATTDQLAAKQSTLAKEFVRLAMNMGKTRGEATEAAKRYGLLGSASNLTTLALGRYVGRVSAAAEQAKNLAQKTGGAGAAQQAYVGKVQASLPVLYALAGGNRSARAQVDALAKASGAVAGKQDVTKKAFMKTADAMGIAKGKATALWKEFLKIKSKKVKLDVNGEGHWAFGVDPSKIRSRHATGGPVPALAPGANRNYDSQPALLRVDEHVWTPEEVDAVGGHGAMYRLRRMALAGKMRGYSAGGAVSMTGGASSSAVVNRILAPIEGGYASLASTIAKTMAAQWKKFVGSGGPVVAAARSQLGVPYSWGGGGKSGPSHGIGRGAGTLGFDCSGLTEYSWWQGKRASIGGTTVPQHAGSSPINGPRPGALGFPHMGHVVLASNKPGYIIQAPRTGAFVEEVPRTMSDWRWPRYALGGEVRRLADAATTRGASRDDVALARLLQVAGDPGPERHVAQVAPAGAMRVWAEPETGGEAYIPLASSKRARSKQILGKVASKFGMSVKSMADGGILGFADGGITADLNLSDILSDWRETVAPASRADVDAAKKSRRTQLDQLRNAEAALRKARRSRDRDRIGSAERRLRAEREDLTAATKKLTSVEARYRAGQQSPATQLGSALTLGIRDTGTFIRNITTLADRGFGTLARQLLAMGGPEAEKIAASAVKLSTTNLTKLQGQVQTAQTQQQMLTNMPNILTARSALKSSQVKTWLDLLRATGLAPADLAAALRLMQTDLLKSPNGKAIWAQMVAQGYAKGGWISGPAGTDRVPISATAGEFMVSRRPAAKYAPLVEAINADRVGDALLKRYIRGSSYAKRPGSFDPAGGANIAALSQFGERHVHIHLDGVEIREAVDVDMVMEKAAFRARTADFG